MRRIPNRLVRLFAFIFIVPAALLFLWPNLLCSAASAASPQEKGGGIKPLPTPTPKKTTPPKKTATTSARTNRAGASKSARKIEPEAAKNPAVEVAFWETIKTSTNPEDFREYLRKYPNGEFAGLARNRLNALETAAKEDAARKEEAKKEEAKREAAKRKEEAEKKRPGALVKNSIGMELVYIPAGSFMMGSENGIVHEKPVHKVTIREGFYMGRHEVTQGQWQAVMGTNPSNFKGDNLPVEQVSWNDAQDFIRRLNGRGDGYTYRLPTEAEWEYACRAGTSEDYAGSLDAMAWYGNNSGGQTHAVGTKQSNAFGLHDMHGNVWEWCEDHYRHNYDGVPTDGRAWLGDQDYERVMRSGSWIDSENAARSASRGRNDRHYRVKVLGFRVVAISRTQ